MKLTPKQQAFADYYIQFGNATEAARRAGYSEKYLNTNANKLLQNTTIKQYIDERMKQLEDERIADANEILQYLTSVVRGQTQEEVIVVEGQGEGVSRAVKVKKVPSEKDKIKAAELLAKRYGLLTENQNINANIGVTIVDDIE